jgi:hypothetical protein
MSPRVSDATLRRWLDSNPDRLGRHLAKHPGDTDRVDAMTAFDDARRGDLASALGGGAVSDDEIVARLLRRMTPNSATRDAVGLLADLMSTSWRTAAVLLPEIEPEPELELEAAPEIEPEPEPEFGPTHEGDSA